MITRVRLKNWRSHLDSSLEFSRGTNALIGLMGSGKSSVLDAISFALYGTTPSLKSKKFSRDDTVMNVPQRMKSASVELAFIVDGKTYEVKREIEKGKGTRAELREDGKAFEVGPEAVTNAVTGVLKMDYELFSRAVYAEQNGLDHFLRVPGGRRMEMVDNLLKIDLFGESRKKCVSLSNSFASLATEKGRWLDEAAKDVDAGRERTMEEELAALKKERDSMEHGLGNAKDRIREVEGTMRSMEAKSRAMEELAIRISAGERLIKALEKELSSTQEEVAALQRLGDAGTIRAGLESSRKELKSLLEEESSLRASLGSLNMRKGELKERAASIESLSKCPVCLRPLDGAHRKKIGAEIGGEMKKMAKEVSGLAERITAVLKRKESLEEETERQGCIMDGIKKKEGLERMAGQKEHEIAEQRKGISEDRDSMADLSQVWDAREAQKLSEARESLIREESRLEERLYGLDRLLGEKGSTLALLKDRRRLVENARDEVSELESMASWLRAFNAALLATQEEMRLVFVQEVNETLKQVWEFIYPYGDFYSCRLAIDEGDYVLQLLGKEGWLDAEQASGGERSTACLALRLAFSLALAPNLRWLFLDEPTHNLDARAVEALAEALGERAPSLVEQIFLITHDERLESAVTGYLYRFDRDKDKGEPTRIERMMGPEEA